MITSDNFLTQLVSEPTTGGASLDLLFATRVGLVGDVVVRGCLGLSDHGMVEFFVVMLRGGARKTTSIDFRAGKNLGCLGCWLRGSLGRES